MPAQLALSVVSAAALGASGLTVYFWRKSTGLYSLLVEGANRFEELRARNTQLEQAAAKSEERLKQGREGTARLEKGVAESREKAAELLRKLEQKDAETKLLSDKLELQKSFLEKQLGKTQEMLRLSEEHRDKVKSERDDLAQRQVRSAKESDVAANVVRQEALLKERELTAQMRDLEKALETAKKRADAVDPAEIKKVRRKIAQYERLYNSMKGLREMTEERNRNYEVALRKLAGWIVAQTQGDAPLPDGIGPLVGSALEVVGAQLIDDNEPHPVGGDDGASLAASMDDDAALDDVAEAPAELGLEAEADRRSGDPAGTARNP